MSQNHYVTKRNRRRVSKTRVKESAKRIAGTMAKLKQHEAQEAVDKFWAANPALAAEVEKLRRKPDNEIDLSDIPEVTDWSGAEVGKFYRPKE